MAAEKGHKKIGGRIAGTKNKKTLMLETFAMTVVDDGMERFQKELNKLEGRDYVNAFLSIFEYVKPKLTRTTVDGSSNLTVNWVVTKNYGTDEKANGST